MRSPFSQLPVSGRTCGLFTVPSVELAAGVKLGACAKMISVGTIVGDTAGVEVCNNVAVGDTVEVNSVRINVGNGDGVTVGSDNLGDKAAIKVGDKIIFGVGDINL